MIPLDENALRGNLEDILGQPVSARSNLFAGQGEPNVIVEVDGRTLRLEVKVTVNRPALTRLRERLDDSTRGEHEVDVLVVPHMPESLIALCRELRLNWLDAGGNCDIRGPGLRLFARGRKRVVDETYRQAGLTSQKSLHYLRNVLFHNGHVTQRQAASEANVNEGQASRITKQTQVEGLARKGKDGSLHFVHTDKILELLALEAPANPHEEVVSGIVRDADMEAIGPLLHSRCTNLGLSFAISGPCAAGHLLGTDPMPGCHLWLLMQQIPRLHLYKEIGFEPTADGDVKLHVTSDKTRLEGSKTYGDMRLAHPGQVYLDCLNEAVAQTTLVGLRKLVAERHGVS